MLSYQRNLVIAASLMLMALLSWVTVYPGTPQVWAPLNLPIVLAIMLSPPLLGHGNILFGIVIIPIFFFVWCLPNLVLGYRYGIQNEGLDYVVCASAISVICWVSLTLLCFWAPHRPSFGHNLSFHVGLFAWFAWYIFPYLGELP
jgi:hypothetical protein